MDKISQSDCEITSNCGKKMSCTFLDERGWRSGESTCLQPMLVESVGSLLCSARFFSGYPVCPSPQEPTYDYELIWFDFCTMSPICSPALNTVDCMKI